MNEKTIDYYLHLPYSVVVTPDEDGGYGVEVAELTGCMTYALKWDEIPEMVREAMTSWIGSALQHNDPVPEPAPGGTTN